MQSLLLTGATGLLGEYLLRDALLAGYGVVVLARATRVETAQQRVEAVLLHWERELGHLLPRPVVLEGNLHQPGLGLNARDRQWLSRHCDSVVHSAASLVFHAETPEGEPYRTNVQGTRQLVDIARQVGISEFHLISTAYVCGQRRDRVMEDELDPRAPFGNDYECSKSQAEQLVAAAFPETATIYRPSIIVGDSRTGYTSTFRGFYTPLRLAYLQARNEGLPSAQSFLEQMGITAEDGKNLVPVDWVSAVTMHVLGNRQLHGSTYHLTHPEPVQAGQLKEAILEALRDVGTSDAPRLSASPALPAEPDFSESMEVYRSYLRDDPEFNRSATAAAMPHLPCPAMDQAMLQRLARYALKVSFSCPRPRLASPILIEDQLRPLLGKSTAGDGTDSTSAEALRLELTGPGGGTWRIELADDEPANAETGCCGECQALLYGPASIFQMVAEGAISLERAMLAGQLVLEAPGDVLSRAEQWVRSLLRFLRAPPRRSIRRQAA